MAGFEHPAASIGAAFQLDGKVAWVTGASRGLGRHIAQGLAATGAQLVVSARDGHALEETVSAIERQGGAASAEALDVSDVEAVRRTVAQIQRQHGPPDVLVNAAGISPTFVPAVDVPDREWQRVIDVNLTGAFYCSREAGRVMTAAGRGSVINVSSVHGRAGMARLAAYSASKAGIEALTRTLALEWAATGVRANCLAPGYFETDMTAGLRRHAPLSASLVDRIPLGRFGVPDELVPAAIFLASDASAYVTGSVLAIDGGWTSA